MTTDEYLLTPETALPQELVYGALRCAEAPTPRHQHAVGDFHLALAPHVRHHHVGEVWLSPIDVILDRSRALVVQPDLIFVSTARLQLVTDRVWGAPDMVLEVLSPHPRIGQLDERLDWFARYGVRECWLLHQIGCRLEIVSFDRGAISDRRSFEELELIRSEVLPDFRSTLASVLTD